MTEATPIFFGTWKESVAITVFLLDPALKELRGHHYNMSRAISAAGTAAGHEMVWIAHRELDPRLVPGSTRFIPAFSSTIYENQIGFLGRQIRPYVGERRFLRKLLAETAFEVTLQDLHSANWLDGDRLAEVSTALDHAMSSNSDRIIVHSADPQTVNLLAIWASRRAKENQPSMHIRTCWSDQNMPFAAYAGGYPKVLQRLVDATRSASFSCETEAGARQLALQTGLRVDVCPAFVDPGILERSKMSETCHRNDGRIRIGWLGEPRREKGALLLPEIIDGVLASRPTRGVEFVLQCAGLDRRWLNDLNQNLDRFGKAVSRLPCGLDREAFIDAMQTCDIMLLPYDSKSYPPERGSGIAVEAMLAGKPIVARSGTFGASLVNANNGHIAPDTKSLIEGLSQLLRDFAHFQKGALELARMMLPKFEPAALYGTLTSTNEHPIQVRSRAAKKRTGLDC